MFKCLRYAIILLLCTVSVVLLAGCYDNSNDYMEVTPMNHVQIPDNRIPELTSAEVAQFVNQYGVSNSLIATDKTIEILGELDVWPKKMFEVVLLLPKEQIPDKVFEKLAEIFLSDLDHNESSLFLELCFDTYEFTNDNESILLKINTTKYEKIRCNMEQQLIDNKFDNRDMLYRYSLFTSIKYIPVLIGKNSTNFQALSVVENTEHYQTESGDNFSLNSFLLSYTGVNRANKPAVTHSVKVYQTAMDNKQLAILRLFYMDTYYTRAEDAIKYRNPPLSRDEIRAAQFEREFSLFCTNSVYAYTKITFSDESIKPVRIIFSQKPTDNVIGFSERDLRNEENDSDEGILIVAEPLTVEHEPQS